MNNYIYNYEFKKRFYITVVKNNIPILWLLICGVSFSSFGQMPSNFQDNDYASGFNGVNGITFDSNGTMYVWEKEGRVKIRNSNGTWSTFIDISEEVDPVGDHGLKGFVLDPDFMSNGYFYLMYEVDRHHLLYYGTNSYNPNSNGWAQATIGRITRYTALASTNFTTVDLLSRFILLGTGFGDGIPIVHETHGVGSLIFGTDGTLIASCGESSTYNGTDAGYAPDTYYQQALQDGILKNDDPNTPDVNENDNVGSWRAQMKTSLSGKIIRIDPATGEGIASNPFYDASDPRSAASRVWAFGFRNPFRITLKPNTGEHLPSMGNPGVIYVGDVGSYLREELDVVTAGGQNFGWPRFEGIIESNNPIVQYPYNRSTEFSQSFTHRRAAFDYRTTNSIALAYVNNTVRQIGTTASNAIPGITFYGNSSTAGIFYQGDNFPATYKGRYFHGDFAGQWIHAFTMDSQDELSRMDSFQPNAPTVTCMAEDPINGYLYYVSYAGNIREIKYDAGNQPPKAVATQSVTYGVKPLSVQFDGSQSSDPENSVLTYLWDFGDGSATSTSANPSHVFTTLSETPTFFNVVLTVKDNTEQTNTTNLLVSVNNTPPKIDSTNIDNIYTFDNTVPVTIFLEPYASDDETASNLLQYKWEPILHHDNHIHPESVSTNRFSTAYISPLPCDGHLYYYEIKLTVTDLQGLSTTFTRNIYPACTGVDVQSPTVPNNLLVSQINTTSLFLTWDASTDNYAIANYEIFINGVKIGESQNANFSVIGLQPATNYSFTVRTKDGTGNYSAQSSTVNATTTSQNFQDELIYGDGLNTNWNNFSTVTALDLLNTDGNFLGVSSIKIDGQTASEELNFRHYLSALNTLDYAAGVSFWVYGTGTSPVQMQVQTLSTNEGGASTSVPVTVQAGKWTPVTVDWNALGNPQSVRRVIIRMTNALGESVYIDELKLTACPIVESVKAGNWDDISVWSCGKIPSALDSVRINAPHTVTIMNGNSANVRFLELLGTLNTEQNSGFNVKSF
jgi:glucose/arabinose dehydrogenase/PKD repeat protein